MVWPPPPLGVRYTFPDGKDCSALGRCAAYALPSNQILLWSLVGFSNGEISEPEECLNAYLKQAMGKNYPCGPNTRGMWQTQLVALRNRYF